MKGGENMNAIAMMLSQHMSHHQEVSQLKPSSNQSDSTFTAILSHRTSFQEMLDQQSLRANELIARLTELWQADQTMMENISLKELLLLLEDANFGPFDDELLAVIKQFLEANQSMELNVTTHLQNRTLSNHWPFHLTFEQAGFNQQQGSVFEQYSMIFHDVRALLAQVSQDEDVAKVAPKLLELLEKWTKLDTLDRQTMDQLQKVMNQHPREGKIWRELLATFQKRHQLAMNQQYQMNAGVTKQDITSWLTRALASDTVVEHSSLPTNHHISSLPMSKLEQYVIHIQQGQGAQPVDKQMMDQLQNMIKSQRFLTLNNGFKQLSISLRPENLGDMMVRLTELNGEMTVKIFVSSQATRQMLEANIHQLKNMFAPHQVVIEESIELNIQKSAEEQDQQDQSFADHEKEDGRNQSKRDSNEDVSDSFHDVLMNLKV